MTITHNSLEQVLTLEEKENFAKGDARHKQMVKEEEQKISTTHLSQTLRADDTYLH